MKKRRVKKKIHPYTEESLNIKSKQLKLLISLSEVLLLFPVINSSIRYLNLTKGNLIINLLACVILFLILYVLKIKNKKLNFSEWSFLDDEFPIITDRRLDGEITSIYTTKHVLVIICNILIIIPISLTFSAIITSTITFIIGLMVKNSAVVNITKFILIFIIFKNFFAPANKLFIDYIKEKKELDF